MGKFTRTDTEIEGLCILKPTVFEDERGYFFETYNANDLKEVGIDNVFVQDNQSRSSKGVIRGLHYQITHPQAKLVRVISGEVYDVAVDLRPGSPTYGKYHGVILSAENKLQFFIPRGFAHGFLVLSDTAEFTYKCDDFYHGNDEGGIIWNDPEIGIDWPKVENLLQSEKDQHWPTLAERDRQQGQASQRVQQDQHGQQEAQPEDQPEAQQEAQRE